MTTGSDCPNILILKHRKQRAAITQGLRCRSCMMIDNIDGPATMSSVESPQKSNAVMHFCLMYGHLPALKWRGLALFYEH